MPGNEPPSSLQSWLNRLRAGDPAAANGIIEHCGDRLKLLTRQMLHKFPGVRQWEETSDVFHDVVASLLHALRAVDRDRLAAPADFLQLAACHLRHRLIDLSRKRRPHLPGEPASGGSAPAAEPVDTTDDPYELACWEEFHSRVGGLPERDRRLFDLIYYQGLTQSEAADLLDMPVRTLKDHWRDAKENLGRQLGGGPFP